MNILFTKSAFEQYVFWQKNDTKLLNKINELLKDIQRNPYHGVGKPKGLRQNLKGYWSRRINAEHRIVYRIIEEGKYAKRIEIVACRFHYKK